MSPTCHFLLAHDKLRAVKTAKEVAAQEGPRWSYLAFALRMLYVVRGATAKYITWGNMTFFVVVLPAEQADKLLAVNLAVLYKLCKSQRPVLSGFVGCVAAVAQCLAMLRLADLYRANIFTKHAIRTDMESSGASADSVRRIGNMTALEWLCVTLPLPLSTALSMAFPGVGLIQTLPFAHVGENNATELLMDVYKHHKTPANAPILLFVHGGGWSVGARQIPPLALIYQVASLGWVVCVHDYRQALSVAFPDHLIDSKRALAFLRRHARDKLDANPDSIVVGGDSAGGHLASLTVLTAGETSFQPGFEDVDNYGVHDFTDRHGVYFRRVKSRFFVRFVEFLVMQRKLKDFGEDFERASPIGWLQDRQAHQRVDAIPPFLISHGSLDTLVPCEDSRLFFWQLQRCRKRRHEVAGGVRDVFLETPGAHHAFSYPLSPRSLAHGQAVCVFLQHLHQTTKHAPRATRHGGGSS